MTTPTPTLTINGALPSRRTTYVVTYGGTNLGLCEVVDPTKFKLNYEPIVTGSTGAKNKLGDRFVGADGTVSVQLRQLNAAQYLALSPGSPSTGGIALVPPLNADMYAYSQPLTLHPQDMGSTTAEDIEFTNAVPTSPPLVKRGGNNEDVLEVEFAIYPSRAAITTSLLNISSGSIGP